MTGKPGNFDYDVEADYQLGTFREPRHLRILHRSGRRLHLPRASPSSPALFLGFDLATGDHNPDNGHLGTFNQLFPSGHTFFGYMDYIGRQNIIDLHPGIDVTLAEDQGIPQEGWRSGPSTTSSGGRASTTRSTTPPAPSSAPPAPSTARPVGGEIDLLLNWQIDRHLAAYFGYSHFFAGTFIRETGPSKPPDFGYAALIYTF